MRLDLYKISQSIDFKEVERCIEELNKVYSLNVSMNFWNDYLKTVKPIEQKQFQLFK